MQFSLFWCPSKGCPPSQLSTSNIFCHCSRNGTLIEQSRYGFKLTCIPGGILACVKPHTIAFNDRAGGWVIKRLVKHWESGNTKSLIMRRENEQAE